MQRLNELFYCLNKFFARKLLNCDALACEAMKLKSSLTSWE